MKGNKYFSRLLLALQSASHNGSCSVKAWLVIGPVVYDLPHRRSVWCVGYSGLGVLWDTWYSFLQPPARAFVDCEWGMKSMREMSGFMNSQERHKAIRRTFMCSTVIWSSIIRLRKKYCMQSISEFTSQKEMSHTVNLITKSMHTLKFLHGCLKKPQYYTHYQVFYY